MVSPQLLLGLAVGALLLLIGGYALWMARRLDKLEEASKPSPETFEREEP